MYKQLVSLLLCAFVGHIRSTPRTDKKQNVLFITVDDLRPELGAYGPIHPQIHTPNIDSLASRSLLFKNTHAQQSVCGPSRTSFLTGRRPDTTKVYNNDQYWREVAGNFSTIPQYFRSQGYTSLGMGKIFHPGSASGFDDPPSWSEPFMSIRSNYSGTSWRAVPMSEVETNPLDDIRTVNLTLESLKRFGPDGDLEGNNFFLGVGFHRPHLPLVFPESFLEYYPEGYISLPKYPHAPYKMPDVAWLELNELKYYDDLPDNYTMAINQTLPDTRTLELRRAYYACVTYIDEQIGIILDEVTRLGFQNNTIISLLGDHGWKLGDHAGWGKTTNFELDTHVPLIIHVPGITDEGMVTEEYTELVDVFPTLVEASGLPLIPLCPEDSSEITVCSEGISLMPLLSQNSLTWKNRVFSQYPRNGETVMGYSMRTSQFRYSEWVDFNLTTNEPNWDAVNGNELYDHNVDPDENYNRADDPYYAVFVEELGDLLRKGWREAIPNIEK